jgi:hypothetical protein
MEVSHVFSINPMFRVVPRIPYIPHDFATSPGHSSG